MTTYDGCINPNNCCGGYCPPEWIQKWSEEAVVAKLEADGIEVPDRYPPAPPRYTIAYWLAEMLNNTGMCSELEASDCMEDAAELLGELRSVGLTVVPIEHVRFL